MKRRPETAETTPAREAARAILVRVERGGAFASILLDRAESRLADRRESALLHELVLGVLRRQAALDHALQQVSRRPVSRLDPAVRAALRIGAYSLLMLDRVPDFAVVHGAVESVRRAGRHSATGFVNAVLRELSRRGRAVLPPSPVRGDVAGLALYHSHPAWWVTRLVERLGWSAAEELLRANNSAAATVLRPNPIRLDGEDTAERLGREGIRTRACHFVPTALRVVEGRLSESDVLRRGGAWVIDEAAQLVPALFGSVGGRRVADLCAAPGGKTMQLALALARGGSLVAVDRHRGRLGRLLAQAARLGIENLFVVQADLSLHEPPFGTRFDQVLLDAPCSGTGTLRRHPEIRWRLTPEGLRRLAQVQSELLDRAACLVASRGSLVYSVCTLEPEEGEQVVESFLERHPEFRIADPRSSLSVAARELIDGRGFLRTRPSIGGLDGFFAVLLRRTSPE